MKIERIYKIVNGSVPNCKSTHIDLSVYYDLGGFNMFTHQEKPRGYYISVHPLCRSMINGVEMESVQAFTGYANCIIPCARQSKKKLEEAIQYMNSKGMDILHEWFPDVEISVEYQERER